MHRKNIVKALLAISFSIFALAPLQAQKFEAANAQGVTLKYKVTSEANFSVQLTGGERADSLVVPATVKYNGQTYSVTSIKKRAFRPATIFSHRIKHLVLPEGLEEIGGKAFFLAFQSDGKETIYIPSSVRKIGSKAFSKKGVWKLHAPRECVIENLPFFVNEKNCKKFGLAKESVARYRAEHPL